MWLTTEKLGKITPCWDTSGTRAQICKSREKILCFVQKLYLFLEFKFGFCDNYNHENTSS